MDAPTQVSYPPRQTPYPPGPPQKKNRLLALAIVLIVLFIIAFGVLYFLSKRQGSSTEQPFSNNEENLGFANDTDRFPNDIDRDGLDDTEEEQMGLSKFDFDTDGDGLSDSAEINDWKTDPTNPDTDGDGFADGYEVLNGFNPNGEGNIELQEEAPEGFTEEEL